MRESQAEYWARRAEEHARLAQFSSHYAAMAVHKSLAQAYRRRAEERMTAT